MSKELEIDYKLLQDNGANSTIWKNSSTNSIGILVENEDTSVFYSQETGYTNLGSSDLLDLEWKLLGTFAREV